jgi:hypothetical protein
MQLRVERAITHPVGRRQRFAQDRNGAVDIPRTRFGFGKSNLNEPVEDPDVVLAQKLDAAVHVLKTVARPAALSTHQALEKDLERSHEGQIMLMCEPGEFNCVQGGARCRCASVRTSQLAL